MVNSLQLPEHLRPGSFLVDRLPSTLEVTDNPKDLSSNTRKMTWELNGWGAFFGVFLIKLFFYAEQSKQTLSVYSVKFYMHIQCVCVLKNVCMFLLGGGHVCVLCMCMCVLRVCLGVCA